MQIADILIGALIEAANGLRGFRSPALDPHQVLSLYAESQLIHLLPSVDFAEQKRFRQGTQAARLIDYFAANFRNK